MPAANILFIITGSIAAYKACAVVSALVQRGHAVKVVTTASARHFIGAATLEGLTGEPPLSDLFAGGAALEHIQLTRWADLVVVCPATANTLNRFAAGLADDLPGALFLARDRSKPWLVAPAMNPAMWTHPATNAAVARLTDWGVHFVDVGTGTTACGESGEGRMAEPDRILLTIDQHLNRPTNRLRVLITSGGTAEPIDAVRVLTNRSTGKTGALLADHFRRRGHAVTLLRADNAARPEVGGPEEAFTTFSDLEQKLHRLLAEGVFDAVVHAAAVSDFSVDRIAAEGPALPRQDGKLDSRYGVTIHLRPNPKLLDRLREWGGPDLQVVAFKLTHDADDSAILESVRQVVEASSPDWIVHNDETRRGADGRFPANIFAADGTATHHCASRIELADTLERLLVNRLATV
ncbi:MAG TPA: bifunctional phosphopantothenoylcysteine decarboxylase/phosphopantothenate--cysteine ligase CoaBC [Candidatus Didemnitutus sp.]|nr:bifunctional phosphopantothenoylcysteine decarboxylase/phosphopantothenate--cysteine ligase CoaBC [Candidatus Didemnitutus sp.]